MPDQIVILVALDAKLFDNVPLDKMGEAESSLRKAVPDIPAGVRDRFKDDKKLSDKDRETILDIALKALEPYQPEPKSEPEPKARTEEKPELETQTEGKLSKSEAQTKGKSEPEAKEKS
jgi:F-type H+-transporting ATPase subunit alpha